MIQIIINHREVIDNRKVLYSLFHLWEHLFVDYINVSFTKKICLVSGVTFSDKTIINIDIFEEYENEILNNELEIKQKLFGYYPKSERIYSEIKILDSELGSINQLYSRPIPLYSEKHSQLEEDELMMFKAQKYDWDKIIVIKAKEEVTEEKETPQSRMANYRNRLIENYFHKRNKLQVLQKSEWKDDYGLVLLVITLNSPFDKDIVHKILKDFDTRYSFLNLVLKRSMGATHIIWPSFVNTNYWTLFMCIDKSRADEIKRCIVKEIILRANLDLKYEMELSKNLNFYLLREEKT